MSPYELVDSEKAAAPNQAWVGDTTYIWTSEGWSYLAVLLDLYSRRVVGWAIRNSLSRELALAALDRALTPEGRHRASCTIRIAAANTGVWSTASG